MKIIVAGPLKFKLSQQNKGIVVVFAVMITGFAALKFGGFHRTTKQDIIAIMGFLMGVGILYSFQDPESSTRVEPEDIYNNSQSNNQTY